MFCKKYNIVVFGADGMLGYDVVNLLNSMQLNSKSKIGIVKAFGKEIDISSFASIYNILSWFKHSDNIKYDIVVNCAAMTDVNKIETDKEYREQAYKSNVIGPTFLAKICKLLGMKLIHISTDYVFSEKSATDWHWPIEYNKYNECHAFHKNNSVEWPVNIYGMQKLIAEHEIQKELPEKQYAILRTSWLYGMHNNKSFVHKFLKNFMFWKAEVEAGIRKDKKFTLPDDQASIPTRTEELATMIYNVIKNNLHGIVPACGFYDSKLGDNYAPSWFKFGQQILFEYDNSLLKFLQPVAANDPSKPKFSRMLNVPPKMHEKLYGHQFPSTWTEQLRWFIHINKYEIDKWLQSQGCFDGPSEKDSD